MPYLVHMNNTTRQFLALPMWALLTGAAVLTLSGGATLQASEQQARPNYHAEAQAIVKAELAREAKGEACVSPASLAAKGVLPSRVLVSEQTGDLTATSVESMTFDKAWAEAEAGRVYIRCAIA